MKAVIDARRRNPERAVAPHPTMSAPDLNEDDVRRVVEALRSGTLALGPWTERFEHDLAAYCGTRHAVAVNSGTSALHLVVRALGLGPGDEVLVPSFTFAASVNAILYERATPVFVDIEPETYNLCPQDLERKVTSKSRAVMVVDVFGHPADWDAIEDVARRHGLALIDDSCEALGAEYGGKRLGRFGHAACFGFYPNKQITTGEGGAVVTDDGGIAALARSMRNQGRGEMGAWLEHERLGFNYRLDEMSAALGVSQLERIDAILARRATVARLYTERLAQSPWLQTPRVRPGVRMSWFVYVVTLAEGLDRDAVMRGLEQRGVPVRAYFSPVHLQPYVREAFGFSGGELPWTESVARRTIALPFHANLGVAEVEHVVHQLDQVVTRGGSRG